MSHNKGINEQPAEVKDLFVLMVNLAKEKYIKRMGGSEIIIERPNPVIEKPSNLTVLINQKRAGQTLH